jgi:hypothetical protein
VLKTTYIIRRQALQEDHNQHLVLGDRNINDFSRQHWILLSMRSDVVGVAGIRR